jgi:hypothetical protein
MSSIIKDREAMLLRDLGPHDVLLGRGTGPNENQGNRLFRDEVRKGEDEYCRQSQSRVAKDLVVLQTIEAVRERGGRFVRRVRLCKKRKNTTNSAPMKRNQQECCDLYEVESKRDIVIEKVRQAFQYCRRRPTQTDKRSTKTNKLSLKSSPDELLLEAKKTSNSSRWEQTPTTTSSSTRRRTAATGTAGTTRPTTSCSLEVETQRHAAVSLREQSAGADEQVQRAILIASIMGKAFEEQQGGALYGAGGADAPSISILQQRVDGGAPVQDPTANSRRNTSPGTSSLFDLGSRSSYSSYYPSMNAAVTTTPPVPNLLQFLSMGTTAKSVVAPSNAFFAYPFSAPTSSRSHRQRRNFDPRPRRY